MERAPIAYFSTYFSPFRHLGPHGGLAPRTKPPTVVENGNDGECVIVDSRYAASMGITAGFLKIAHTSLIRVFRLAN